MNETTFYETVLDATSGRGVEMCSSILSIAGVDTHNGEIIARGARHPLAAKFIAYSLDYQMPATGGRG